MSLIWDLLHGPEKGEARVPVTPWDTLTGGREATAERRKSSRRSVYVPLFVYGYDSAEQPFHQQTYTLQVNANGGLVRLDAPVKHGQKLLLLNRVTNEEQECSVVAVKEHPQRSHQHVGVCFTRPAPEFWQTKRA